MKHTFTSYEKFVFVFAHPDDEAYTAATIHRLVASGKEVDVVYVTKGDYVSQLIGKERQAELAEALAIIGVSSDRIHRLGISERSLFEHADTALQGVRQCIERVNPDCVVGHDYEGGHNAHDLAGFAASTAAQTCGADFWTFPAYFGPPTERTWNQFIPGREADYEHKLDESDRALKRAVLNAHETQKKWADILMSVPAQDAFLSREVLRDVGATTDYACKPTEPLGYEPAASSERFDAVQEVVKRHSSQLGR